MRMKSALKNLPDVELSWDEALSGHTTFRVGGPVRCLARPRNERALSILLGQLRELDLPVIVLGAGSNILPPDQGLDAVAIKLNVCCGGILRLGEAQDGGSLIYAGAGTALRDVIRYCVRNELEGLETLAGIPGTVGGALIMNAGTALGTIYDGLIHIDVLDSNGVRRQVSREDLRPSYRFMGITEGSTVIGGCFKVRQGSSAELRARIKEIMDRRKKNQPLNFPSAGSIFKNPPGNSAWQLIEKAGLKGFRVGGAEISKKHANWIINRGNASSADILEVIGKIEKEIFGNFGVRLEREIRILGAS